MKIRPKIPMLQGGNNIWYNGIQDYDPTRYVHAYDTSRLVNPLNFGEAWASRTNGYGRGRYVPNPNFTRDYVKNVIEANKYYQNFTNALFNTDGTLSDVGKAYARLSDNLLPKNSLARVYNGDQMRSNWTTTNNDTYGRPGRSFNNIKNYLEYERTDNLPGGRHNVFLDKGKRYFYVDNEGKYHWVSPEDAAKYKVSEKPVEQGWGDDGVYWEDYEITGPSNKPVLPKVGELGTLSRFPSKDEKIVVPKIFKNGIPVGGGDDPEEKTGKNTLGRLLNNPNLFGTGRFIGSLLANESIYNEALQGIRPTLRSTYRTHRQIVGDEATKQAYYRRAAAGQTRAARPFTSDADRQMAYQFEAKRIGDELRAQGDLADNQEIRRTSDESNQHQWANIQRATEVANANRASMIQANALKHNLLAQKHAAQWSSIDNYLKELETRQRQNSATQKQIWQLRQMDQLENDEKLIELQKNADDAWNNSIYTNKASDPKVIKAYKELNSYKRQQQINMLESMPYFGKTGMKITYKKKDDLLYKSTRDVVEHFRKMSKMSSDSYNRRTPKIEKLLPYPKGNTRKYQQGGLAPFVVYTPTVLGGDTTISSQTSTGSTGNKNSDKDETLEVIKELFKNLEGLPSDVNGIYSSMSDFLAKSKLLGNELSTSDLASMYLQQMQKINAVKFYKKQYDDVAKIVNDKNAISEFAIDQYGRVAVQNKDDGKIEFLSWNKVKENLDKYNPLYNGDLLNLRATNPSSAFDYNMLQVAGNATSMQEIGAFIKNQSYKLGSTEIEGYTKREVDQIKAGIEVLKDKESPEKTKDQKVQAQMALQYLNGILPRNMKTLLKVNADLNGVSYDQLLSSLVGQQMDYTIKYDDGSSKKSDKDSSNSSDLKLDAATALITGKGYNTNMSLNVGSSYAVNVKARYSEFQKHSGENMGAGITMKEASTSTLKGVLDWNKATLGGSTLNPTAYNYIVLNNGEVAGMDLPTKPGDKNTPDFEILKKLEQLDDQLLIEGIEDSPQNWQKVNEVCSKLQLPPKYDNQGNLNKQSWNRFAAFQVITTEKALNDKSVILDMLGTADDQTREFYENIIQDKLNDKKYSLDNGWPIFGGKEEVYQGTVFVPVKNNLVAGAISSGQKISMTDATDLELKQRGYDKQKISTYKKNELVL